VTETLCFALTGGIGSGKSTVAAYWRSLGLPVIDADELARAVVQPGSPGLAEIGVRFGADLIQDGQLDRRALAARVFGNSEALAALNAITHPRVRQLQRERLAALGAQGEPLVAYEVPLLYENGLEREFFPVVVVWVPAPLQRQRALERGTLSGEDIDRRILAQLPLDEKARRATFLIDNSGSVQQTHAAADRVLSELCQRVGVAAARYGLS
jgi:dephospho-CoA kinase